SLVNNNLINSFFIFCYSLYTFHPAIVFPAHSKGKDIVGITQFFQSITPIRNHIFFICKVIITSVANDIPFCSTVSRQRLAVGGPDIDSIFLRCFPVALNKIKRNGYFMHRRPNGVCTQPQQEFKNPAIGFWTDGLHLFCFIRIDPCFYLSVRLECFGAPRCQPPIFIIQENAPVLYIGTLGILEADRQDHCCLTLGHRICPPYPWRDTNQSGQLQHAISGTMWVASHDEKIIVFTSLYRLYMKGLPLSYDRCYIDLVSGEQLIKRFVFSGNTHQYGAVTRLLRQLKRVFGNMFRIAQQHFQSSLYQGGLPTVIYGCPLTFADQLKSVLCVTSYSDKQEK